MRRLLILFPLALGLAACGTLGFKGGHTESPPSAAAASGMRNMFAPVAMRIHPVTRLTTDPDTGKRMIEAYIEFVDQFGDIVKAAGRLRFEAYAQGDTAARRDGGFRQEVWEIAIDNVDSNRRHFDPITRSYAFKLALTSELSDANRLSLSALFQDDAGARLHAEKALSTAP